MKKEDPTWPTAMAGMVESGDIRVALLAWVKYLRFEAWKDTRIRLDVGSELFDLTPLEARNMAEALLHATRQIT